MDKLVINNLQIVPIKNIDTVYIDQNDKRKLSFYTVGGFTITNNYQSESDCLEEFKRIEKLIDDYKEK